MTVIMTAIVANLVAADPENGLAMAFTVVMLAGIFQIISGTFKLGKYITLMPYSVISGFMLGIGVILIILQLASFVGQPSPKGGVIGMLQNLPQLLSNINPVETFLGVLTLAIENAIQDACDRGLQVFIVGAAGKVKQRLERFGILSLILSHHLKMARSQALREVVALVQEPNLEVGETALGY